MIIPISQDINKFFVNINGTSYPVKKMLFNGQGVQNVEVYADYYSQYFTIESLEDGNEIQFSCSGTSYMSTDNGVTWPYTKTSSTGQVTITINTGEKILVKSTDLQVFNASVSVVNPIRSTKTVKVYGNLMSVQYGENFEGQTVMKNSNLSCMFRYMKVVDASNLKMPATTLVSRCYERMFQGCTTLTKAPELPATTLAQRCYEGMFKGCSALQEAPSLPAITLASRCYYEMFRECTALTKAPILPATTLASECYYYMFYRCTSLVTAPELPATTLANNCYQNMFSSCTALTTAPELPAATLKNNCYQSMFSGCRQITRIVCLATDISATGCTSWWVNNFSSSGTFYKNPSMSSWTTGVDGIPSGWTVVNW